MIADAGEISGRQEQALLRARAEARMRQRKVTVPPPDGADALRLIHELEVHQIELEMQYEELLSARAKTEQDRARYLDLYDFAPTGFLTLSPDGTILQANVASATLLDTARAALVGQRFPLHVADADRRTCVQWLTLLFDAGTAPTCALSLAGHADTARSVRMEGVLGPDRSECRVVLLDVTEHRRLELALRRSQRMESVGRLAGGIAHDFNNLLTVINGYADVLQEELSAETPLGKVAREIGLAGARAAALTSQLLSFSRRQPFKLLEVDINTVVREIGTLLVRLLGPEFDLQLSLHPTGAVAAIDAGQLGQLLMNLALNARDAMPHGGTLGIHTGVVHLTGSLRHSSPDESLPQVISNVGMPPGEYVVLIVADTGTGMTSHTADHLFEPFFTTKSVNKGTGLGLALVYGIVQQFGGHIIVRSAIGRGSEFSVYLPRAEALPVEPSRDVIVAAALTRAGSGGETLLLVEDERAVRALTRRVLEGQGYTVLEAATGEEALRLAAGDSRVALLLTDVRMPGMDGPALARAFRTMRAGVPVLFMSGDAELLPVYASDNPSAPSDAVDDEVPLLQKPFGASELARMVRATLDRV